MISSEIIKIASNTKYVGLKNIFTHKSSVRNHLCGDTIKLELIVKKFKIKSLRYESESCILCEASASLLANKVHNLYLKDLKKDLILFKDFKKKKVDVFPKRFKEFKNLLNGNMSRINCVILPIEGLIKAFNINK